LEDDGLLRFRWEKVLFKEYLTRGMKLRKSAAMEAEKLLDMESCGDTK
jgi:hypothetical protein